MFAVVALMMVSQQPIINLSEGYASFYTVDSSSHMTASKEILVDGEFTCAMREGEFGTYYRITADNGRTVVCRLNDRGPFVKGRIVDLSEAAMRQLDPSLRRGIVHVKVEPVSEPAFKSAIFRSR